MNNGSASSALIQAVGTILRTEGFRGLDMGNILRTAGYNASSPLIKKTVGSLEGLLRAYMEQTDFWLRLKERVAMEQPLEERDPERLAVFFCQLLREEFYYFYHSTEMQELILFSLSRNHHRLKTIFSNAREASAEPLLLAMDRLVGPQRSPLIRAAIGYIVGAIYTTVYHMRYNRSLFCGLDFTVTNDQDEFLLGLEFCLMELL